MDGAHHHPSTPPLSDDDFKIKGFAFPFQPKGAKDVEPCTICLQPITERAVAVPCNHLSFDFICLVSWLQEKNCCPLCKAPVTEVQYDWAAPEEYKTYRVPVENRSKAAERRLPRGRRFDDAVATHDVDPSLARRRHVYLNQLYSLHVGANRVSGCRDFSSQIFASTPSLQSRARMFLRRELQVFGFLDTARGPYGGNRDRLIEYVVLVLKTTEIKGASGRAEEVVAEILGRENARRLLHELEAWLRSPFQRLAEWDAVVQYADGGSDGK